MDEYKYEGSPFIKLDESCTFVWGFHLVEGCPVCKEKFGIQLIADTAAWCKHCKSKFTLKPGTTHTFILYTDVDPEIKTV